MNRKLDYIKIVKIAAGAGIAIVLADALGLNYSASAGIITLLSIQDTKKETIRVMLRRVASFLLALILAAVCFALFGYNALAISVFLLFFSSVCILFQMQEGISVNTVLVAHFLAERSMSLGNMGNEVLLLLVGAGIGVILNLYIPGKQKEIKEKQGQIEGCMKKILCRMSLSLSNQTGTCETGEPDLLTDLDALLDQGERSAYEDMENQLLSETKYYIRYMNMRKMQAMVLLRIEQNVSRLKGLPPQADQVAGLLDHVSVSFHEHNNAVDLLKECSAVKDDMRRQPLPAGREEFENRAVLFQILLETEQLLLMKREFVEGMSEREIERFWK